MRTFVLCACLTLLLPFRAMASCDAGSPASYDDITYVKVQQFALVGGQWPWYTFDAVYYRVGMHGPHASASLDARRGSKLRGTLVAVDPLSTFAAIIDVLKKDRFFSLHLTPAKDLYLDGPEDEITVSHCGVTTSLGTIGGSDEYDLNDAQAKKFFALEADLRAAIFAQQWEAPPPQP